MRALLKSGAMAAALSMLTLGGCVSASAGHDGLYAAPIGDAPVTSNPTPYSEALVCIGADAHRRNIAGPRIAVGRILDYTGKTDPEGGRRLTQGASLMAITAFAKAGARLVERFDTSVSEMELRYANNKLIADQPNTPRQVFAGQVPGSDYYLVGGITELNYNIRSVGADAYVGTSGARDPKGSLSGKVFVMNIGLDLRLVSTQTLEVVDVVSYQKQVIGREVRAGVFSFWGDTMVDVGAGERALEPLQMAVRAGVERGVVEMMANLYGIQTSQVCGDALAAGGDPMGSATDAGNFRATVAPAVQGARRVSPDAWNADRDPVLRERLAPAPAPVARTAADTPRRTGPRPGPGVLVTRSQPVADLRGRSDGR